MPYRGRIAPSPTGYLHLGHAVTFRRAQERAEEAGGTLVLRVEDLDRDRCRAGFVEALYEDLRWFGLRWQEGPDVGGPFMPYRQSERRAWYVAALEQLRRGGFIYPCRCSRRDIATAALAPHPEDEEPIYPGTCRPPAAQTSLPEAAVHWRFRVPEGRVMEFVDGRMGREAAIAGIQFGDFVVWRRDDVPAYQLAVVVDDAAMQITEVVRGADLLTSTFRQLLLYEALDLKPPAFYHAELVLDEQGRRLAKRHAALSLRALREAGADPAELAV